MGRVAIDTQACIDALKSHALSLGHFSSVNSVDVGSTPPSADLTAVVYPNRIRALPSASGLNSTSVAIDFMMRLIRGMNVDPLGSIDVEMITATDALMNSYSGNFTLGGLIAYVDLLGQHGESLNADSGFIKLDSDQTFRIVDITIPCIINDVWNQAE